MLLLGSGAFKRLKENAAVPETKSLDSVPEISNNTQGVPANTAAPDSVKVDIKYKKGAEGSLKKVKLDEQLLPVGNGLDGAQEITQEIVEQASRIGDDVAGSVGVGTDFFVAPNGTVSIAVPRPTHANAHGFTLREINLVSGRNNCASCSVATDRLLSGTGHELADLTGVTSVRSLEQFYSRNFVIGLSESKLVAQMTASGNRGIVFGSRGPGRVGHFFNGVNQKGTVRFLDGQTGTAANLSGFTEFWFLPTH